MLYGIDKYLAAAVVGFNFFILGIEESSLYTILPKYLNNQSINKVANYSIINQTDISQHCYIIDPPYVIVSMIFLAKNVVRLVVNLVIGGIIDKMDIYITLAISQIFGIVISIIYAFINKIIFYIIGRIIDGFISSLIFVSIFSILSNLFTNAKVRGRYFGLANVLYFISHSIGPFYGALVDEKLSKSMVFLLLIPMWCVCLISTLFLYWKIKRNIKLERKNSKINSIEVSKIPIIDSDKVTHDKLLENVNESEDDHLKETSVNLSGNKNWIVQILVPYLKMFRDPYILGCLSQIFIINLCMYSLPPTLPLWMATQLCSTEIQQGLVWTFGSLGYSSSVMIIIIVVKCIPKFQLYVPVIAQITVGILLILLPLFRDWRLIFIPVIGMYFGVGIVEQVIFPLTTILADNRFQSNYGMVSSLTSQSLTLSGVIGTLCGGYIASKLGFLSLSIGLGVINIISSPLSVMHRKII